MNNFRAICVYITQIGSCLTALQKQGCRRVRHSSNSYSFRGFSGWVVMTKDSGGELMIFDSAKTLVFSTEVGYEGDDSDKSVGPLSLMLAELRRVRMLEDARNSA